MIEATSTSRPQLSPVTPPPTPHTQPPHQFAELLMRQKQSMRDLKRQLEQKEEELEHAAYMKVCWGGEGGGQRCFGLVFVVLKLVGR